MNLHVKTSLILLATLLLGFALGVISTGWFVKKRFDMNVQGPNRYSGILLRIIDPSDEQLGPLTAIIDSAETRFRLINGRHRDEMTALIDSIQLEIAPILTPEQQQRLNEHIERVKRFRPFGRPGSRDRRNPPWHDRPSRPDRRH